MSNVADKRVRIFIDDQAAESSLSDLQERANAFNSRIEKARQTQERLNAQIEKAKAAGKPIDDLKRKYDELNHKILGYNKSLKDNATQQQKIKEQIDKGLGPSLIQQQRHVERLNREFKQAHVNTKEWADSFKRLNEANKVLDQMKGKVTATNSSFKSWMKQSLSIASGVMISQVVTDMISSITSQVRGIFTGNAKLSDELADIEKAGNLSTTAVKKLNSEISKINTRTSMDNLRGIAIGLGQAGEEITAFNVQKIDEIVVALGDEFGNDAQTITKELSILRNNLQDIKTNNYGEDVSKIGNALNVLGASGQATAPVVTDFANRMAGVAQTFGISSGAILGNAAAFQELGINVERGSTAYIKILQKIAAEPAKFAKVANESYGDFVKLVNTDLNAAFLKVAQGAKNAGSNNVVFARILKELDADGSGAGEVLSKVALNADLVAKKIKLASEALMNNNSITDEFNKKNNNLAANLEKLSKNINSWFSKSSFAEGLNNFVKELNAAIEPTKKLSERFDEQKQKVATLEKEYIPLLKRYDDLKALTHPNVEQQNEMKEIIEQITKAFPGAISQVNEYGQAIAISTDRVRGMITEQRKMMAYLNEKALKGYLSDYEVELRKYAQAANNVSEITRTGTFSVIRKGAEGLYSDNAIPSEVEAEQIRAQDLRSQLVGIALAYFRDGGDLKKINELIEKQNKQKGSVYIKPLSEKDFMKPVTSTTGNKATPEGNKDGGTGVPATEDELRKAREALEKLEADAKKSFEELQDIINKANLTPLEYEFLQIQNRADALRKVIEQLFKSGNKELIAMGDKLNALLPDAMNALMMDAEDKYGRKKITNTSIEAPTGTFNRGSLFDSVTASPNRFFAADGTIKGEAKANMPNYDKELDELQKRNRERIEAFLDFATQAVQIWQQAADQVNQLEQRNFDRELRQNERRRREYEFLSKHKVISAVEAQRRINELDIDEEKKREELERRQFERNKRLQIAQTFMNSAAAAIRLWISPGMPQAGLLLPLLAAQTLAQIAVISSQKFAKGGIANGPDHSRGGVKLVNSATGEVTGEMEGGEPYMILSKNTYRNNKGLIDNLLYNSMYKNGAPVEPHWNRTYVPINTSGWKSTSSRFEKGGVYDSAMIADKENAQLMNKELMHTLLVMQRSIDDLNIVLSQGINANVPPITLKSIQDAQTDLTIIQSYARPQ